jgi:hypothetical protein
MASSLEILPKLPRTGGSGFTAFHWMGYVIGFAQAVAHTSPQPVAAPVAIQPLDQQYPMAIITPAAVGPGTLQLRMFEMFGSKIWDQIMKITDSIDTSTAGALPQYNDLSEVFLRLSALARPVSCTKMVYPPNAGVRGGRGVRHYADLYHNCVITDIRDDEQIEIGTMDIVKAMTIQYTYSRRIYDSGTPGGGGSLNAQPQ